MTQDELVEKVARAISSERGWPTDWDKSDEQERAGWRREARAAIAVVVEECAKVADEWGVTVFSDDAMFTLGYVEEIANTVAPNIAAAIRKLGETK
jgi:hypothetical protein